MPDRIRRAVATVACAIIVFIIAGLGFAKMIEDPAYATGQAGSTRRSARP